MQSSGTVGDHGDNTQGVIPPCSRQRKVTGWDVNPCSSCREFFLLSFDWNLRLTSRKEVMARRGRCLGELSYGESTDEWALTFTSNHRRLSTRLHISSDTREYVWLFFQKMTSSRYFSFGWILPWFLLVFWSWSWVVEDVQYTHTASFWISWDFFHEK